MGPLAGQILLQSLALPFVLAAAVMILGSMLSPRGPSRRWADLLAPAFAIGLATSTAYVLAFGWPIDAAISARAKIMLAALAGLALSIAAAKAVPWSTMGLAAGAVVLPLWIGLPVLQQGRPEAALIILPIAAALVAPALIGRLPLKDDKSQIMKLSIMAFGIAGIAAFAQALSFAELGLGLGGALLAVLIVGRGSVSLPAILMAAAMIQALITALLLYSGASIAALTVLIAVTAADRLYRLAGHEKTAPVPILRSLLLALLPAVASVLIARIDAGPISIY